MIALAACGDPAASPSTTSTEPTPAAPATSPATSTPPTTSMSTDSPPPTSPGTQPPPPPGTSPVGDLDYAIADLQTRLGTDAVIEVVSQEEVTWRDGSLGCPQPGWSYTQALVNGTRIVLRSDGVDYAYHAGGRRRPFLCETPSKELDATGGRPAGTPPDLDM
jgi:hypothetical protein